MTFADFDPARFLRDYWQQRPLLIRNPWPAWRNPVDPDTLAGLAGEPEIESRLIISDQQRLGVEPGPIAARRFGKLGQKPWTLLVQAVDHHVPDVAALIEPFRFIPNWRIDDVMVSYATDGGGVGPHFDQYDVFLIQGLGTRRWQVGGHGADACTATTPLLPHDDLRLLADFVPVAEWLLGPGDILYVPPGVAHNGVAVGDDCMTYSVGFRAPSRAELVAHYCDHVLAELDDDDRYGDRGTALLPNPGEIAPTAIDALYAMVFEMLGDKAQFARWFGSYTTTPKYPEIDWRPDQPLAASAIRDQLARGATITRNPASRFAFVREGDNATMLFVDGEAFVCAGETLADCAHRLCATSACVVDGPASACDDVIALLETLFSRGAIAFAEG